MIDKFSFEILSKIKENFESIVGVKEYQDESQDRQSARQFYLKNLDDNLFCKMSKEVKNSYLKGSGNELNDKMKALRSSSALTYNMLGNDSISIIENNDFAHGDYIVEYEWQCETLTNSRGAPANLDALLTHNDEIIAIEVKMCEWIFNSPSKLKDKYLHENNYIDIHAGEIFTKIAKSLICFSEESIEYPSIFTNYDGMQMFKHSIALYNACQKGALSCKKLSLVNCVWEATFTDSLSSKSKKKYLTLLETQKREFDIFYEAMTPIQELFKDMNIEFNILYYNSEDFIKKLSLSTKHSNYLKRY